MASIANLIVTLGANIAGFETDMKRASKSQQAAFRQMQRDAEQMGRAVGVAFAAAAAATAVVVTKTINAADHIHDLSIKTGIGTEALSVYAKVAEKSGTSVDVFVSSINKMQKNLVAAAEGGKAQSEAFQKIGLSISDLMKLSPEKQFEAISEKLSGVGDAAQRAAIGQAIFGKGFANLAPLIADGAKGFEEAEARARKFGDYISEEFAASADKFNDNMVDIKSIGNGIAIQFTEGLIPALIDLQEGFIGMDRDISSAKKTGEGLGQFLKQLVGAFIVLKSVVTAVGVTIVGTFVIIANALNQLISPLTGLVNTLDAVGTKIAAGDIAGGLNELGNTGANIATAFNAASAEIATAGGAIADSWWSEVPAALDKAFKLMNTTTTATEGMKKAAAGATGTVNKLSGAVKEWTNRQKAASKSIEENIQFVEELEKEQEAYNATLQDFIDIGDPVGAMVREFSRQLEFANTALATGKITLQQYQASLNVLSDELGQAAAGMQETASENEAMTETMLEGVRILERTFNDLWTGMLDGSLNAFDAILSGLKAMIANIANQKIIQPLVDELTKAFGKGGGGIGSIDTSVIGQSLAGIAGLALGSLIGGAVGSNKGANIGSAVGTAIGTAILPGIGTVIGGILGGLVGGLLGKKKTPLLEATGNINNFAAKKGDFSSVETVFGKTWIRARHLDDEAIAQFKTSLEAFDNTIGGFLDDSQISKITDSLAEWDKTIEGKTLSIDEILNSRFVNVLSTFSDNIQTFVNGVTDLEDKVARLQVGVGTEKLFADQPDLFAGHTVDEFLAVVVAFKRGTASITDAFREVVQILDVIATVKTSLQDFGSSNLGDDFAALLQLQSESVVETLTRLTSGLDDAMRNWDGSPEQLVEIGNLALSVRQQELTALSLIDSVAKGLNANLDRLLADTKATISGPKAPEQILFDARALITAVSQATTPEGIAAIGQEFEALIRSLSPEDTKAFGTSTLAIIESFKAASNAALEQAKQSILDSGEAIRLLTDNFAALIDPLAIIASTNERAAAALELLASGTTNAANVPATVVDQTAVLSDGITTALSDGVDDMAAGVVNAIRQGFAGANVTVNVTVQEPGLVTQ